MPSAGPPLGLTRNKLSRKAFNEWAPWSAKPTLNVRKPPRMRLQGHFSYRSPVQAVRQHTSPAYFTSLSQGPARPRCQLARYHDALSSAARHSPRMTRGNLHAMSRRLPEIGVREAQSMVLVSVDLPSPEAQQRPFSPRNLHANLMPDHENCL